MEEGASNAQTNQDKSELSRPNMPQLSPGSGPAADLGPFNNMTEFLVQYYHWMLGAKKTDRAREQLVDMTSSPYWDAQSARHTNWRSLDRKLVHCRNEGTSEEEASELIEEGWRKHDVDIPIPFKGRATYDPYSDSPANQSIPPNNIYKVANLWTRSLSHLIRQLSQTQSAARQWQWMPYREYWQSEITAVPDRVYGEMASSDAFMRAHEEIQRIRIPGCPLPKAVISIMIWSDSTHLGSFSDASLHPVYIGFGNESKYTRGEPSSRAVHQIAFIPKVNDSLHDFLIRLGVAKGADAKLLAHCRRELMHAVWAKILDDDFVAGYKEGWAVICEDGIQRRLFPRIFTYSADYPEKLMLACIRDMGDHPCPRCYVSKANLDRMGTPQDKESRVIERRYYAEAIHNLIAKARASLHRGFTFASVHVDALLKQKSLVPTINTFSRKLGAYGLDHYQMLVIDFMHEFELGVWRSIIHHIVRILDARGDEYIREFDKRLRSTPTFGPDTIRKMRNNVSQFKKFAARDYEDLLQIIIPAMEGLLPDSDNTIVIGLLYVLAVYLSLGKLRLHTDHTLAYWEVVIGLLGDVVRQFRDDVCPKYPTKESAREAQARARRGAGSIGSASDSTRRTKQFNILTYKFHAIGDGPSTVRLFGTTDSYSTWIGELLHKRPKSHFGRTAKNYSSTRGVTLIDSREEELIRFGIKYESVLPTSFLAPLKNIPRNVPDDPFPLEDHHYIPRSENSSLIIAEWLADHRGKEDVAILNFVTKLENHLITRFFHEETDKRFPDFPLERRRKVFIQHHKIYTHKRMRIHYTAYDVRRAIDIVNLQSGKQDILVASHSVDDPFSYARVVGIYHVKASYDSRPPIRYDLLWVRWLVRSSPPNPVTTAGLDAVCFDPSAEAQFGFVDPSTVIRSSHLIPAWHHGVVPDQDRVTTKFTSTNGLPDYRYYYINKFVDRDMYMRYLGGGVGHAGGGAIRGFCGKIDALVSSNEEGPDISCSNGLVQEFPEVSSSAPQPSDANAEPFLPPIDVEDVDDVVEDLAEDDDEEDSEDSDSTVSDDHSDDPDYDPNVEEVEYDLEYSL
ncbi:hypothetical protein M408DRAFT_307928 [Serendipita vermifera MAFF 305830]|uniref:Uncharacterized protein n=2 Tax=Serendipita vermifera MAFF 305830 TaxID=933852 RepID=A0A0C2XHP8_SERVB|nr:hypothetical protein M408DRAFT_307928 [Serendipita vermifera MAFF 305830]